MSNDLQRFHATFFEESREGLDAMEAGLLALESGSGGSDTIHTVFRAAHSIKGGAATFGFQSVTALTHLLETLLDELRDGRRTLTPAIIEALLNANDVLRHLLHAAETGEASDANALQSMQQRLQALLDEDASAHPSSAHAATDNSTKVPAETDADWKIDFRPHPTMFMGGNDPLRILRELDRHGTLSAQCDVSGLPSFANLDPLQSYFAWHLALPGATTRSDIDEAFAWVTDECALDVQRQAQQAAIVSIPAKPPSTEHGAEAAAMPAAGGDNAHDSSIRVAVGKVDALINLVGELVITQAMLKQQANVLDPTGNAKLLAGLEQLDRNTRQLQETVISVRMLPVESAFRRMPRLVRDLATRLDKQVRLRTSGEATELDKGLIELVVDPLVHLVRNAVDHGLETPEMRLAAGKEATGTITLAAAHQGSHIVIEVADDGRGLDRERIVQKAIERGIALPESPTDAQVWDLIFHPGFSTAQQVTDVSGRGVGMDVVKKNIGALGGEVEIQSRAGLGTRVIVRLPLTLAIIDGMSIGVGEETFILPLNCVIESLQLQPQDVRSVSGKECMLRVREEYMPLLSVHELFNVQHSLADDDLGLAVVIEADGRKLALRVDRLIGQQQVVVKSLESNYRRVQGISGATILGDGSVALIIDAGALLRALAQPQAA